MTPSSIPKSRMDSGSLEEKHTGRTVRDGEVLFLMSRYDPVMRETLVSSRTEEVAIKDVMEARTGATRDRVMQEITQAVALWKMDRISCGCAPCAEELDEMNKRKVALPGATQ